MGLGAQFTKVEDKFSVNNNESEAGRDKVWPHCYGTKYLALAFHLVEKEIDYHISQPNLSDCPSHVATTNKKQKPFESMHALKAIHHIIECDRRNIRISRPMKASRFIRQRALISKLRSRGFRRV